MTSSYRHLPNLLTHSECDKILNNLPQPDYSQAPAIDRTTEKVPLNTWYKMEKVPIRIELDVSEFIKSKLVESLDTDFTVFNNRMYITKYNKDEYCVPHSDPAEHTIIIQLNSDYKGGLFTLNDTAIEMYKGDAVLFNNYDNLHGVRKIKEGSRSSLALWVNFDK
jgi:hypothetical protein